MTTEFLSATEEETLLEHEDVRKKRLSEILATQFALQSKNEDWSENQHWFYEQLKRLVEHPEELLARTSFNLSPAEQQYFHESLDFPEYKEDTLTKSIPFAELASVAELHQGCMHNLHFKADQSVTIERLLATIRCEITGQIYADSAMNAAVSLLTAYTPSMVPENKTAIMIDHLETGDAENGTYYGTNGDKNIISLQMLKNPFRDVDSIPLDQEMIKTIITLTHELGHARHDELFVTGEQHDDERIDAPVFSRVPDWILFERFSPSELASLLQVEATEKKVSSVLEGESLSLAVVEGLAVLLEVYIQSEWKKKQLHVGDTEGARYIQDSINTRFAMYAEEKQANRYDPYRVGFDVIRKLGTFFSKDELVDLARHIDLYECSAILANTPLGKAIQRDPRLLPGLLEQPVVRDSLAKDEKLPLQENLKLATLDGTITSFLTENAVSNLTQIEVELDGQPSSLVLSDPIKKQERYYYNGKWAGQNCVVEVPYTVDGLTDLQGIEEIEEQVQIAEQLHQNGVRLCYPYYATTARVDGESVPVVIRFDERDLHQKSLTGVEGTLNIEEDLHHDKRVDALTRDEFMQNFYPLIETIYDIAQLGLYIPDAAWGLSIQRDRLQFFIHDVSQIRKATQPSEQFSSHRAAILAGTIFTNSLSLEYREESDIDIYWFDDEYVQREVSQLHKSIKRKKQFSTEFNKGSRSSNNNTKLFT